MSNVYNNFLPSLQGPPYGYSSIPYLAYGASAIRLLAPQPTYGPPAYGAPTYGPPTYLAAPAYPAQPPYGQPAYLAAPTYGPPAYLAPPTYPAAPAYGAPTYGPRPTYGPPAYAQPTYKVINLPNGKTLGVHIDDSGQITSVNSDSLLFHYQVALVGKSVSYPAGINDINELNKLPFRIQQQDGAPMGLGEYLTIAYFNNRLAKQTTVKAPTTAAPILSNFATVAVGGSNYILDVSGNKSLGITIQETIEQQSGHLVITDVANTELTNLNLLGSRVSELKNVRVKDESGDKGTLANYLLTKVNGDLLAALQKDMRISQPATQLPAAAQPAAPAVGTPPAPASPVASPPASASAQPAEIQAVNKRVTFGDKQPQQVTELSGRYVTPADLESLNYLGPKVVNGRLVVELRSNPTQGS